MAAFVTGIGVLAGRDRDPLGERRGTLKALCGRARRIIRFGGRRIALYQNSKTLTHATCATTGTSIAKTYGGPMGYGRVARTRTVAQMSQCLRSLVLAMRFLRERNGNYRHGFNTAEAIAERPGGKGSHS
jgi:hypothetical protein